MASDDPKADTTETVNTTTRRSFVTGAVLVGGAAALAGASTVQAQSRSTGKGVRGSLEVKRPAGLGPRAMLDNRFPESFAESVPKSCEVIMGYFTALNQRDLAGMAEYLHFPFATIEGINPVLISTPDELLRRPPPSMNMDPNPERFTPNDGYMKKGCYDVFRGLEVHCMDPVNAALSMSYDRYDADGKKLLRCEGVYSITNNDGRWAIQAMSTIFTPADMIGLEYPDGVMAAKRRRINLDIAYQESDPREFPERQQGALVSVMMEDLPYTTAPEGKTMERFKIKGVTSRLQFTPADAPRRSPARDQRVGAENEFFADYREDFKKQGFSGWGWVYGQNHDTRVLHQTYNKIHLLTGAIRYTQAGEECSSNYDVEVITYRLGHWRGIGNLCYTTPHDRSNNVLPSR